MALSALNKDTPIFKPAFEYQESTLQLPFGEYSIFSDLQANRISPIEAMVTLVLCYRSTWSTGLTWPTSSRALANLSPYLASLRPRHAFKSDSMDPPQTPPEREHCRDVRGHTSSVQSGTRADGQRRVDRCLSLCRGVPVACLNVSSLAISTGKPRSSG